MEQLIGGHNKKEIAQNNSEIAPTGENETLVFLSRLNNPVIRERLINDIYLHESTVHEEVINYKRVDRSLLKKNLKEILGMIRNSKPKTIQPKIITRESIARDLEKNINQVFQRTDITLHDTQQPGISPGIGQPGIIAPRALNPVTGERFTNQTLSMAEAHEKGHGIRRFSGESDFTRKLMSGFDFSAVPQSVINEHRKYVHRPADLPEIVEKEIIDYFMQPIEIIERMSQLKNYFGMKGDEVFTKEHLGYVRKHYADDYQFPPQIEIFLRAITPETEDAFIKLMNTLGV